MCGFDTWYEEFVINTYHNIGMNFVLLMQNVTTLVVTMMEMWSRKHLMVMLLQLMEPPVENTVEKSTRRFVDTQLQPACVFLQCYHLFLGRPER